jgi:hypothetical protein
MEKIKDGIEIGKHEMVGVIFEVDEIYRSRYRLGKKPEHGGKEVKAFKGGDEVEPEVEKMVKALNKGSSAYQRQQKELKEENRSPSKRVRKPLTTEGERRKIKRMARDPRVIEFFSG